MKVPWAMMVLLTAAWIWPLVARAQSTSYEQALHGSISGRLVFGEDNRPAERVQVELRPWIGGPATVGLTGINGEFEVSGLPTGTYVIVVSEPGYEPIQETVHISSGHYPPLLLYLKKASSIRSGPRVYAVSVRELKIPRKALHAFEKGLRSLAKKDPGGSLVHFERAAAAFPNYYEAYYQMGTAYMGLGRSQEAEQAFQKSIDLSHGRFATALRARGLHFCRQGRFAEAELILRKSIELDATSWEGPHLLSLAVFGLNRLDEAEKFAYEVVRRKPDFALSYLVLANIHIRKRDHAALLSDLEAYLRLQPNGEFSAQARQMREQLVQRPGKSDNATQAAAAKP